MRTRLVGVAAATAAAALVLVGCSNGGATPTETGSASEEEQSEIETAAANADPHAPEVDTLRAALWQGPISAQFFIANDIAQENYGLSLTSDWMTDANVGRAQLAAGEIELTPGSPYGAVQLIQGGTDTVIVAGNYISQPGEVMVFALPGSGIESVADLAGKTIAMTSVAGVHPNRIRLEIQKAGGDPNSLTVVASQYGEMAAQLNSGVVDAVSVAAFALANIKKDAPDAVKIFDLGEGPYAGRPENVWSTTRAFYLAHPNAIAAFQCSIAEAGKLANEGPAMVDFMKNVLEWPQAVIDVALPPISAEGPIPLDKLQADWDEEVALNGSQPFDVSTILVPWPTNC